MVVACIFHVYYQLRPHGWSSHQQGEDSPEPLQAWSCRFEAQLGVDFHGSWYIPRADPFPEFSRNAESYWAYQGGIVIQLQTIWEFQGPSQMVLWGCQVQSHWRQGCHPSCKKHQGGIRGVCRSNLLLWEILNVVKRMTWTSSWGWIHPTISWGLCIIMYIYVLFGLWMLTTWWTLA